MGIQNFFAILCFVFKSPCNFIIFLIGHLYLSIKKNLSSIVQQNCGSSKQALINLLICKSSGKPPVFSLQPFTGRQYFCFEGYWTTRQETCILILTLKFVSCQTLGQVNSLSSNIPTCTFSFKVKKVISNPLLGNWPVCE